MDTTTRSALNSTFGTRQARQAAQFALTGMLAVIISVLVTAERPAAHEEATPSRSHSAMSVVTDDTTVPAASSISHMVQADQPATF